MMGYSAEDVEEMRYYANAELRKQKEKRLWLAMASLYVLFLTIKYLVFIADTGRVSISSLLDVISSNILSIFFLVYAPGLFHQIFNLYPIEFLRISIQTKSWPIDSAISRNSAKSASGLPDTGSLNQGYITQQIALARESNEIAEKIYSRAGAYLFLGCSIAFVGVAVFNTFLVTRADAGIIETRFDVDALNSMTKLNAVGDTLNKPIVNALRTAIISKILSNNLPNNDADYVFFGEKIIDYLPRLGALLLIELVAFFFLKQYRAMLEEYRYYEAIKRKRQDTIVASMMLVEHKDNKELLNLILMLYPHTESHKLNKEETTQIIESQKIINNDMDLLSKIVDLVKSVKAK